MTAAVIPCQLNAELTRKVAEFADALKADAHTLGTHGLTEHDFYQGGIFRGAIERIRGQYSATMFTKREFVQRVLEHMQDRGYVKEWVSAGSTNRFDYTVTMPSDRVSVIELKGCLDGNNTVIYERPAHAQEFVIWSVCSNPASDPRKNVWSGIHTRLSAEIIDKEKLVDGVIVWDWICGTIGRPCPKLKDNQFRVTAVAQYKLTPPCIYLFPSTVSSPRNNPNPEPHALKDVEFLDALHRCFVGADDELNYVRFLTEYRGNDLVRTTTIERNGVVQITSGPTAIRRR
jgi:hypothetical protein